MRGAVHEPETTVRVRAVLLPPPDAARPGGFDYSRQAFFMGIGGTGYAVARPERLDAPAPGLTARLAARVERLRDTIGRRIREAMGPEAGGLATALVTGQRGHIPEETEETLRAAGLAHILAISGLHMMLVVGAIFAGIRYGAALVPEVALTRPVKKWAAAAALLGGTAYLVLSGASIATQRAWVMATVLLVAVLADRPAITMRNVAIAAFLIILMRPEAVVSAGFQMSFAATVALVAAYEGLRLRRGGEETRRSTGSRTVLGYIAVYVGGLLLTSLVAGAATAPFAAYHFHRIATYGLLGNLLAMPVFSLVVMPMGLFAVLAMPFGLEAPFLAVMEVAIRAILAAAGAVAGLDGAVRHVPAFHAGALAAMTLGAAWLAVWRTGWRWLGGAALAAGIGLATLPTAPDAVVSRSGRDAALNEGGRVTLVGRRGSDYEREHWLAAWGLPPDAGTGRAACDGLACYHAGGPMTVSIVSEADAFAEDCDLATVLVAQTAPPAWCGERALVIGPGALERGGAVSIRLREGPSGRRELRLDTASGATGPRPWNWRWRRHGPPDLPESWPVPQ